MITLTVSVLPTDPVKVGTGEGHELDPDMHTKPVNWA
jgi:hypothetical protein